jgi:hypothetical protein
LGKVIEHCEWKPYETEQRVEKTATARFPEKRMFAAVYSVLWGNVVIEMTGVLGIMKVRMLVYNKLKVHIVPRNVTVL